MSAIPQASEEKFQLLKGTAVFSELPEKTVRAFSQAMERFRHAKGEVIMHQGDSGDRFHVLASGHLKVSVHAKGAVVDVATLTVGDCFGEMSLLTRDPASADVSAVEDCETLSLDRTAFEALVSQDPGILTKFIGVLSHRLRATGTAVGAAGAKGKHLTRFLQDEKADLYGDFIGKHPTIGSLRRAIAALAAAETPVFIFGEAGTGKEALARQIHFGGKRKAGPIVSVDCAQITVSPWGDKLFGAFGEEGEHENGHDVCYLELAAAGTILLGEIQDLPPATQRRLAQYLTGGPRREAIADVRVIATSKESVEAMREGKRVAPELLAVFGEGGLRVPALRERKKDIPELAQHFLDRHSRRFERKVTGFDDQALTKMVSYDFPFANVQELKETVERAVILSEKETISGDEVFLGSPPKEKPLGFNWLRLPFMKEVFFRAPRLMRWMVAAGFLAILVAVFSAPSRGYGTLGTTLVWAVWWPALMVSFLFLGRMWCSVCPMAFAGTLAQKIAGLQRRVPNWVKEYDFYIMGAGFFAIMWIEETTGMRHDPFLTGLLLLGIGAGAVLFSILYPRRSWCRHICPLGGFAAFSSASAMVELRPTYDICSAKCTGHACYKGNETIEGCPMFGHVMFQSTNHDCVLCMNCVFTCPNDSPQFNLRVPGRELWATPEVEPKIGRTLGMMGGLLIGLLLIQSVESNPDGAFGRVFMLHRRAFITAAMAFFAFAALGIGFLAEARIKGGTAESRERFWRGVFALAPLITGGFVAYQLGYGYGLSDITLSLSLPTLTGGAPAFVFHFLTILRFVAVTVGLCITLLVAWKVRRATAATGFFFAAIASYWGLAVFLISGGL